MRKEIEDFVRKIATDLQPPKDRLEAQRKDRCCYLKEPLPLDSTDGTKLITQELYRPGKDADDFLKQIKNSISCAEQDKAIFCCAATSGVGKTRLAHAAGKFLTMVLVRVAHNPLSSDPFTAPWAALYEKLIPLSERRDEIGGSEEISARALRYIKVLICCYVDASVIALEIGKALGMDRSRLRELVLRFNRNDTGESFVERMFKAKCDELFTETNFEESRKNLREYRDNINKRFEDIFNTTSEWSSGSDDEYMLLCFDEIQELLNRLPRLFIQNSKYGIDEIVVDDDMSRDLFYGVACAMRNFVRHCGKWAMLMTGTHLSISKLQAPKGVSSSLLRSKIEQVPINFSLMTNSIMKEMLQYYWDFPDAIFTEPVMKALDRFRGRPYFFVEIVFRGIYIETCTGIRKKLITSEEILDLCENKWLKSARIIIRRRIEAMFEENKAIPGAGDRTVSSLIPALIKTSICGDGKLILRGDPDISRAITDGVILASSLEGGEQRSMKNIKDTEPLVFEGLINYLSSDALAIDRIMNLVLNQIRNERGATAEEMFSYWIALTTFSFVRDNTEGIPLGDLLHPLYDGIDQAYFPRRLLNEYVCDATKVEHLNNSTKGLLSSLRITQGGDSKLESMNTKTVFFGIDTNSGVDIVFLVKNQRDGGHKLVAIQSKNDKNITVQEVLMALSPGLQYLENPYREFVITGTFPRKKPEKRSCGPGFVNFDEWREFCTNYDSSIGNNWIRVALVSRKISPSIHQFLSSEYILDRLGTKAKQRYDLLLVSTQQKEKRKELKERAEIASRLSPAVFLSLSAEAWLTAELRDRFISLKQDDTGISFPKTGKKSAYWVPVSVATSAEELQRLDI